MAHSSVLCVLLSDGYGALLVEDLFPARALAGPWGSEDEESGCCPCPRFLFVFITFPDCGRSSFWLSESCIVTLGLRCSGACGILVPNQGSNLHPLHREVDS